MGRKDTLAAKSIRKMYEQLNLNQSDIFSKTKLLLSVYRDVVWITLSESARVNEELVYYGEELDSALVYLELFAPDTEKQEFESRISALFENKWMVDLIDTAMAKIYDYHNNGRLYHEIISKSYPTTFTVTLVEPYKRWEFDMENSNMKGHWTGVFTVRGDETEIYFTECVEAKKLFMKPFVKSYLKKQQAQFVADMMKIFD